MTRALPFLKNLILQNNIKCSGVWDAFYWKPPFSSRAEGGSVFRSPSDGCEPASVLAQSGVAQVGGKMICALKRSLTRVSSGAVLWYHRPKTFGGLSSWSRWFPSEQAASL